MTKAIVVTGASSGIGRATVARAIRHGFQVFGSVRNADDALTLRNEFGTAVEPLIFDVRDEDAIKQAAGSVADALGGVRLGGLVNNAGVGLAGPLLHQPVAEIREVLDTNLLGVILVTRAFAGVLGADPRLQGPSGRIVNISSIAGKVAQPFAGAYVASKHALEGLSHVMRRELALHGIKVSIVAPSTVDTPIWDEPERVIGDYADTPYGSAFDQGVSTIIKEARSFGLNAEQVAEVVLRALIAPRPRLRYAPARIPLTQQFLPRLAPDRVIDLLIRRLAGLRPH